MNTNPYVPPKSKSIDTESRPVWLVVALRFFCLSVGAIAINVFLKPIQNYETFMQVLLKTRLQWVFEVSLVTVISSLIILPVLVAGKSRITFVAVLVVYIPIWVVVAWWIYARHY